MIINFIDKCTRLCYHEKKKVTAINIVDYFEIGFEALKRKQFSIISDDKSIDEFLSLVLDRYPDGSAVIIGFDKDGKPCGYAERSLRGTMTEEPLTEAMFGIIPASAVSFLTARKLYEGDSVSDEFVFARRIYDICQTHKKKYLDHAVYIDGTWVRIVSKFKCKITGKSE